MADDQATSTHDLWKNAPCGLLLASDDGTILRVNATFCSWTGYQAEHLEGKWRVQNLLSIGGRIFHQTHWAPLLQLQGSVAEVKLDVVAYSGERIPMLLNAVRRDRDGSRCIEFATMVVKERNLYEKELIAARRAAEESLTARAVAESQLKLVNDQLSAADRRKDEFLAILAHELRNPLAPIRNALEVLNEIAFPNEVASHMQQIISRQVRQMTRLVDDLLDVARINRGHIDILRVPTDLRAVATDAVETLRPIYDAKRIELSLSVPTSAINVDGDAARLAQVVGNLLNNALKFTDTDGSVDLRLTRNDNEGVLTIKDTGIGISESDLPRLFEMFMQVDSSVGRAQGGLGIGLMLVKYIVESHGGCVSVRSEGLRHGSEFEIRLPISTAASERRQAALPALSKSGPTLRKVLVVDDNEDGAMSMAEYLRLHGHDVCTVFNGESALTISAAQTFDSIVLDIGLPGLDGYEVAARIRAGERNRSTKLIALTGWGQDSDRLKSAEAGFDLHLVKPVNPSELAAAVISDRTSGSS